MLPGSYNILCSFPIDAIRPCIYLACYLRKRLIVLFRLAHWPLIDWHYYEDCTLSRTLFGCRFCQVRAKQLPGPLAIGFRDSLSLWATSSGSSEYVQDLLAGKGALHEFTLSRKATTLGPVEQPASHDTDRVEPEASRSSVSSIKRK